LSVITRLTLLDLSVLALAFAFLWREVGWQWWQVAAIAGACAPDFMWGAEKVLGRKIFGPLGAFHKCNHNRWKVSVPAGWGVPAQIALTGALWWFIVFRF
jgi:hypothetical protein